MSTLATGARTGQDGPTPRSRRRARPVPTARPGRRGPGTAATRDPAAGARDMTPSILFYLLGSGFCTWGLFHLVGARRLRVRAEPAPGTVTVVREQELPPDAPAAPNHYLTVEFADA